MKIDPYNHQERYFTWKGRMLKEGISEINKENSDKIRDFIFDMEMGLNVSNACAKGGRSYVHLNNLKQRMIFMTKQFEQRHNNILLTNLTEQMLFSLFTDMRSGRLKRKDGTNYISTKDFVKVFKTFWHWYMKISKKKGVIIEDITTDLDTSYDKPKWVYLTEDQFNLLLTNAPPKIRILLLFLYDTGIRAPTELMNIKVSDFYNDFKELNIRDEVSKTFGRRIKLMLCSEQIKNYIISKKLTKDEYVFKISPPATNRSLQRLAKKLFGEEISPAGEKYSEITMYDFRHNACCYWLPRYKSESAIMYRFGWKKSDKIHYYSELLGMKDTITEEDLTIDKPRVVFEQRQSVDEEKEILKNRLAMMEQQMKQLIEKFNSPGPSIVN
jgi:integrase